MPDIVFMYCTYNSSNDVNVYDVHVVDVDIDADVDADVDIVVNVDVC